MPINYGTNDVNTSGIITAASGNFINSLQVNGTGVSISGHTHTSSDITNFNSSVSGLLPTIANSGDNRILTSTGSSVGIDAEANLTFNGSLFSVTGSGSFSNNITASGFVRSGGTSSQFLKADGSVDSTSYQSLLTNPVTGIGTSGYLTKWISSSGVGSGIIFDNGTSVGIGTSNPSGSLDVRGDVRISGVATTTLNMYDVGAGSYKTITMNGNDYNISNSHIVAGYGVGVRGNRGTNVGMDSAGSNSYLALAAGGGEKVRIATDGKVGIGTSSPSSKLDVNGNVNIDGNLTFDSFTESVVAIGNSSTSQTLSLTSGTVQTCTLTGNCTFTMPATTAGKSFTMFLNTGSGNYTATFSGVRWADSATPTATILANKVDIYSFISDGSYWYGSFSQNYG